MRTGIATTFAWLAPLLCVAGCWFDSGERVVVYTALDQDFSEPVFADFSEATDVAVDAKYDTESTKTVALAEALIAEGAPPRADVFWNNEILNTIRLERLGLLAPYSPAVADDYPAMYRSPEGTWHGFAARARVLVVNTDLVAADQFPTSVEDLAEPKWRGRAGIAKPLFGTTATHAACLFALWGPERAEEFFRRAKANDVKILAGNRDVAREVGAGNLAFGLTDTDDALIEQAAGSPLAIVYPDQQPGGPGTLFIPNTLAILKGAPHPDQARRLVDYLLSPQIESRLADGPSAQIPLGRRAQRQTRVKTPQDVLAMHVDFAAAADQWERAATFLQEQFTAP